MAKAPDINDAGLSEATFTRIDLKRARSNVKRVTG
jgi:hypothetical protein